MQSNAKSEKKRAAPCLEKLQVCVTGVVLFVMEFIGEK